MSRLALNAHARTLWQTLSLQDFEDQLRAVTGCDLDGVSVAQALPKALGLGVKSAYQFACFLLSGAAGQAMSDSGPWWAKAIHDFWPGGTETDLHRALHQSFARQPDVRLPLLTLDAEPDLLQLHGVDTCQFDGNGVLSQSDCLVVPLSEVSAQPFANVALGNSALNQIGWQCRKADTLRVFSGQWADIATMLHAEVPSLFPDHPHAVSLNPVLARYLLAIHGSAPVERGVTKPLQFLDCRQTHLMAQFEAQPGCFVIGGIRAQWGWSVGPNPCFELLVKPDLVIREIDLCREKAMDIEGCECLVSWRIAQDTVIDQPMHVQLPVGGLAVGQPLTTCKVTVPVHVRVSAVSRVGGPIPVGVESPCGEVQLHLMAQIQPESQQMTVSWCLSHEELNMLWRVRRPLCGDTLGETLLADSAELQSWSSDVDG